MTLDEHMAGLRERRGELGEEEAVLVRDTWDAALCAVAALGFDARGRCVPAEDLLASARGLHSWARGRGEA